MLGAAGIARTALIPAIAAAGNAELVAISARDPARAREAAPGVRVVDSYRALVDDPEVEAVYVPLPNSLHRPWAERALAAGKHVLCEKPLAMTAAEVESMAGVASARGRLLMEALMYRFHPRIRAVVEAARAEPPRESWISFGFGMSNPADYRASAELGGGALYDVGSYCVSLARWIHGEPEAVSAQADFKDGVDWTVRADLTFPGERVVHLLASFMPPEVQELRWPGFRLEQPFTAWRDPVDPYQVMVEAFAAAIRTGGPVPIPPAESMANLRVLDAIRAQVNA